MNVVQCPQSATVEVALPSVQVLSTTYIGSRSMTGQGEPNVVYLNQLHDCPRPQSYVSFCVLPSDLMLCGYQYYMGYHKLQQS